MIYDNTRPVCSDPRTGCFACEQGRCGALYNTDFRGGPCPFYATQEMRDLAQAKTRTRLLRIGRPELLDYIGFKKIRSRAEKRRQ